MTARPGSPGATHYFNLAVQHLELVDDQTSVEAMRLHCHFALLFVQIGLERQAPPPGPTVLTLVERR